MIENMDNSNEIETNTPLGFSDKLRLFFNQPSIFHGVLLGLVLFAAKLVFYLSQHWDFILEPSFMYLSFAMILYAVFTAGKAERNAFGSRFTYFKAYSSGFKVMVIGIAFSVLADGILYNIDSDLANETVQAQIEKAVIGFKEIPFISDADKDMIIKELKKQQLNSFSSLFSAWFGKVFLNSIWIFITAIFLRYKPGSNDWLNAPDNENQGAE